MSTYIGFIGCGNMGGALARAAAKSDMLKPEHICIADKNTSQAEKMAEAFCRMWQNIVIIFSWQ